MIDSPHVATTRAQPAAVIRFTIPKAQIREVMGPAFQELFGTLGAQGIGPAGPAFSHHFRMDPEVFDFVLGVPVSRPVEPAGRVENGELPAARVAQTTYRGDYEGLGPAWGEFMAWVEREALDMRGDFWEVYRVGPESGGPEAWETDLVVPLA
jgi:effector-binding domain-containing protein